MPDATSGNPLGPSVDGTEISIPSEAQGDILIRGASNWQRLGAGTSGQFLKTQGAGANPLWANNSTSHQLVEDCADASGGAVTTLDIASLDLDTDGYYQVIAHLKNVDGSARAMRLYANGNTTNTNYYCQTNYHTGGTNASVGFNDCYINADNVPSNSELKLQGILSRGPNGYPNLSGTFTVQAAGTPTIAGEFTWVFNSAANLTSLQFTAAVASAIGQNSKFTIFKLKRS